MNDRPRSIIFAAALAAALLVLLTSSVVLIRRLRNATAWVDHTAAVRLQVDEVLTWVTEAESKQRAFLLTDDPGYLTAAAPTPSSALESRLHVLQNLVVDNPSQSARARALADFAITRVSLLQSLIADRRAGDASATGDSLRRRLAAGQVVMTHMQDVGRTMNDEEDRLMIARSTATQRFERYTIVAVVVAAFVTLALASGLVSIERDIQRRKRLEIALRAERTERERLIGDLARSNRDLDQFAYVASHDLKAPLRGIANLSAWIAEDLGDKMTPESQAHLDLMRGRVRRLEGLIDGILAYARAGRAKSDTESIDLRQLVADVVESLDFPEPVRVEIDPALRPIVGERVAVQQVLQNLIGNAVKHARRPDAVVSVLQGPDGQGGLADGFNVIAVRDNGPGIAPQFHERIWGIFQTLQARDVLESTGIGLSIVKKLVETRNGRVWVESEPGQGATFFVAWPREDVAPATQAG